MSDSDDDEDGCDRILRLCFLASNVLLFIGGAATFCLPIWMYVSRSYAITLMSTRSYYIAFLVLVGILGVAFMLVAVLGFYAANRESRLLLVTFFTINFVTIIGLLISGVLQYFFIFRVLAPLPDDLKATRAKYGKDPEYTAAWNDLQITLQCCGVDYYTEWTSRPNSCCRPPAKYPECNDGCSKKVFHLFIENAVIIGVDGIIMLVLLFVASALACAFRNTLASESD